MININDFPHPPKHYKTKNKDNFQEAPNFKGFLEKTKQIVLFGENISLQNNNIRYQPEYTNECRAQYFKNVSLRENFELVFNELK